MIEERGQNIREDLEDAYDEKAHEDPFSDLLCQGGFHDLDSNPRNV